MDNGFSLERAEKSLIKKFHKQLFRKFTKAVVTYNLIQISSIPSKCELLTFGIIV